MTLARSITPDFVIRRDEIQFYQADSHKRDEL